MYEVGETICLWQEKIVPGTEENPGSVMVLKEVLVTITGTKTGVPYEFSGEPASGTSIRGIGDDGKVYEKHWDFWPESQTCGFQDQWSVRNDGEGDDPFWAPKEAVHTHNQLQGFNKENGSNIRRLDKNGNPILPKGDVVYCEEHDDYRHRGGSCFHCLIEEMKKA